MSTDPTTNPPLGAAYPLGPQGSADRWAIQDVVNRYFMAIDRRDFGVLRTCFTDDVVGVYEGVQVAGGVDRIMDFFEGRSSFGFPLEIEDLRGAVHFAGNHVAEIEGDTARAHTYALAHLLDAPGGEPRLRTRALRYVDELVRVGDEWRIRRREHILEWMKLEHLLSPSSS